MKKIIHYITYNDTYSGIYQSQVIDVVKYLNKEFNVEVKLIAFVPLRLWKEESNRIKTKISKAKVYPILGSLAKVKRTSKILKFISNKSIAICRGPLAYMLADGHFSKVVYDGRAAVEAEVNEYNVTGDSNLNQLFIDAENDAIRKADYFISVSNELISYWNQKLGKELSKENYSIIPCTLSSESNHKLDNIESDKVRVVYAGGTGAWQSFEKVVGLLDKLMLKQPNVEVLFLTKENEALESLQTKYPNRCERKWVKHNEVYKELASCDYGILLRDDKVTNRVASPVKFAEYLNAGLKVLISPHIGDFSEFTSDNDCGIIIQEKIPRLNKVEFDDKKQLKELCKQKFYKNSKAINDEYLKLISFL